MTDCCTAPPSIGTWKIYVRMPIYFPNRIKWNWNDGTGWHQIEGDDYTITKEYPNAGIFRYSFVWYYVSTTGKRGTLTNIVDIDLIDHQFLGGASPGETYFTYKAYPNSNYIWYVSGCDNGLPGMSVVICREGGSSGGTGWSSWSRVKISESNNQRWTLRITSCGQEIYNETKNTLPTVEKIPEKCLQNEQRTYVRDYQNWNSGDYCQQVIQDNQNTLLLMNKQRSGGFLPVALAYDSSPEECEIAPIFEIDCILCKKCPENTCEIICGDTVCCYGEQGDIVDSFSVEELC